MIVNPVLVGIFGTLFVEMALIFVAFAIHMIKGRKQ